MASRSYRAKRPIFGQIVSLLWTENFGTAQAQGSVVKDNCPASAHKFRERLAPVPSIQCTIY